MEITTVKQQEALVNFYIMQIKKGSIKIENVPQAIRGYVREQLNKK